MARYYFHLSNAGNLVRDVIGEEFAREDDARIHAVRIALELARNSNDADQLMHGRHLIVMHEAGRVVCNVPLHVDD